jgi:RHS repeat-associated protein
VYIPGGQPAYYRHADWLGSSRLATTPSSPPANHLYFDGAYAPFGEDYAKTGTTDPDFTGQNQDTVQGLYDFMYREYHPVQGRWISPDPAGLAAVSLANPQSWNRYAYVTNRATVLIDPLGLCDAFICVDVWAPYPDNPNPGGGVQGNPHAATKDDSDEVQRLWNMLKRLGHDATWWKTFFKTLVKGPSTGPGSCLGLFTDTVTAPLKQLQSAAKNYVPLIVSAMQAAPAAASSYVQQLNIMVQSGAADPDPEVVTAVTTAGAAAATAAPYASAAAPYLVPVGGDAILLDGVIKEVQSGMNGQCTW